jgi:hypothetical protein
MILDNIRISNVRLSLIVCHQEILDFLYIIFLNLFRGLVICLANYNNKQYIKLDDCEKISIIFVKQIR